MKKNLTLTVKKEVIEIAKDYAKEEGQSLSEMVENYLKLITAKKKEELNQKNFLQGFAD